MSTANVSGTARLIAWTGAVMFAASLGWFLYSYLVRFGARLADGEILRPVLVDTALFTVFALHHSLLARAGMKAVVRRYFPPELERSVYTWTSSLLFLGVCSLWQPVPGTLYELPGWWAVAGYLTQVAGVVLTVKAASAVDPLDLAGVRQILPARPSADLPHLALETGGLYAFVRHPVYFAWLLLVFGTPVMTGTRATFAIVSTLYLALAIPWEERSLMQAFGREYEEYRRRVRWRMVPGIY